MDKLNVSSSRSPLKLRLTILMWSLRFYIIIIDVTTETKLRTSFAILRNRRKYGNKNDDQENKTLHAKGFVAMDLKDFHYSHDSVADLRL